MVSSLNKYVGREAVIVSQAAVTNYHRLGGLTNRSVFLPVLEAVNPRSRCHHGPILMRALSGLQTVCLLTASSQRGGRTALLPLPLVKRH